jgi:NADPH:quinone reductase-like Zn-dependent oxidoreductase
MAPIVVTASLRQADRLKALGADYVVDYNDPECPKKVKEYTDNRLTKAMDAFSQGDSLKKVTEW